MSPDLRTLSAWEIVGILAACIVAACESLAIITIQATRTAREPDTLELAGLTAAVGQPPGGDHEYQLAHDAGWLPAHDGTAWEWKR
jgi:hypothetical protein